MDIVTLIAMFLAGLIIIGLAVMMYLDAPLHVHGPVARRKPVGDDSKPL